LKTILISTPIILSEPFFIVSNFPIESSDSEGKAIDSDMNKVWTKTAKDLVDRTKEEEFDDYFKDMFL
jgi:hypothetical protein